MDKANENREPNSKSSSTNNNERSKKWKNGFKEKFEADDKHHSYCLSASGCFERHNTPREAQYLSNQENRRADFSTFNRTEYQEGRLMNMVTILQKQGCSLLADESLEQYVLRNKNKLNEQDQEALERSMDK